MERRAFIAISAAAGATALALAASCASFSEGDGPGSADAGEDTQPSAEASAIPDGALADAPDAPAPVFHCSGTVEEELFERPFAERGWTIEGSPIHERDAGAPPPSLFAETQQLTAGESADGWIKKDFPLGGRTHVCIELDMFLEQLGGTFTQDAYAEVFDIKADARSLFAEMRATGFSFTDVSSPTTILGFEFGKWTHLVAKLTFDSVALPSIEVIGSGQGPVTGTQPMGDVLPAEITVQLGLESRGQAGTAGALRVRIDNFRFTSSP